MTESVCRGRCRVRPAETAFQRLNFHYNARMDGELLDLHYFAERRKGSTPLTTMTMSCSLNDFVSITSSSFGSPSIPNLSSRAQVIFVASVFFAFRSSRRREPGVTRSSGILSCSAMIVLTSSQVTGRGSLYDRAFRRSRGESSEARNTYAYRKKRDCNRAECRGTEDDRSAARRLLTGLSQAPH